jgi:hypothetical protein
MDARKTALLAAIWHYNLRYGMPHNGAQGKGKETNKPFANYLGRSDVRMLYDYKYLGRWKFRQEAA